VRRSRQGSVGDRELSCDITLRPCGQGGRGRPIYGMKTFKVRPLAICKVQHWRGFWSNNVSKPAQNGDLRNSRNGD